MMIAFVILAAILLVSALGVVLCINPIYSAIWLITNLLSVAGVFALLNAHFLAVAQIIVYAGAIMVLFLFVVMLLNLKDEVPTPRRFIGRCIIWLFGITSALTLARVFWRAFGVMPQTAMAKRFLPPIEGTTKEIGKVLYTDYIFAFEAASLLIIAAVIGAVMLAKRRYRGIEPVTPHTIGTTPSAGPAGENSEGAR